LKDETRFDYESYLQADMAFHSAILDASNNELLAHVGQSEGREGIGIAGPPARSIGERTTPSCGRAHPGSLPPAPRSARPGR
jgi:hypothetical protein